SAVADYQMWKIQVKFVRWDIGADLHEAHITQGTFIDYLFVILFIDTIQFTGPGVIDQIEQRGEGLTEVKTTPATVADIKNTLHLGMNFFHVVKIGVFPVKGMAYRCFQTSFTHRASQVDLIMKKDVVGLRPRLA